MANEPPVKGLPVLDCSPGVNRKLNKVSSKPRIRQADHVDSESETEGSDDSVSITSSQTENNKKVVQPPGTAYKSSPIKHRKRHKSRQEWEIIEGLKDTQRCEEKPDKYQGFLMKRRRWPMKGWHKRFFVLEKGILYYAKSASDIQKGKYHGIIDTGLSVLAFKSHRHRIDIDAEDIVYHIKVKEKLVFEEWLKRLRHHRLYRQHEIAYGTKESPRLTEITSPTEDINVRFSQTLNFSDARESKLRSSNEIIRQSSFKSQNTSQGRVAAWLLDTAGFEHCNKELMETQKLLCDLFEDLEFIRSLPLSSDSETKENDLIDCKKKGKGLMLRSSRRKEKKSDSSMNSDNQVPTTPVISAPASPGITASQVNMRTSSSNPNLVLYEQERVTRPQSVPDYVTMSNQEQKLRNIKVREEFLSKAETVHRNLKSLLHTMSTERERLKGAIEVDNSLMTPGTTVAALRNNLAEVCRQNEEMRSRLARIHSESMPYPEQKIKPQSPILSPNQRDHLDLSKSVSQTLSVESCSMSEYYDAEEENKDSGSESSTEASDEEEISDEISEENDTDYNAAQSVSEDQLSVSFETGRRSQLPVPKPDTGDVSLWNILYKNIGKDLTKISMPVTLNEPLSMLQRLCEELEYSELIDKAAEQEDPYSRMMYIAAFAVSGYASSGYRAGHKPFNPILGETYECVREDKGWKFVSEQVSHHPPISACFCESKTFTLWQDTRIKTKFWGKSMEIQPIGLVHLKLPKYKDHYEWNKVTTCVHNILGGQRWVDQYGEMHIRNGNISCKLTFKKASQWSSKRHEVYGQILNPEKKVMHSLFGKWNEALYCGHAPSAKCIWRPGAMPDDFELYYGFTRFAIELNELDKEEIKQLPPTDTRFRPDQRLLEEGKIQESENEKQRVEQLQREYRKKREEEKAEYQPLWFKKYNDGSKETYMYTGKYWDLKKDPGFYKIPFTKIW